MPTEPWGFPMIIRRAATVAVSIVATVALSSGAASAHYCYFDNPNPHANEGRAKSHGFFPFSMLTSSSWACVTRAARSWPTRLGSRWAP